MAHFLADLFRADFFRDERLDGRFAGDFFRADFLRAAVFLPDARLEVDFLRAGLPTRSGSFALPVSRLHSSNVSGEISPFTSNSANLRRCAWLLNGMRLPGLRTCLSSASYAPRRSHCQNCKTQ